MSEYTGNDVNTPTYTTTAGTKQAAFDPSQVASTGAPNYEGTPTEYYDKSGNLIGYLGKDNTVQATSGLNFMPSSSPINRQSNIQLTDENGNLLYQNTGYQPSTDPASQMYITQGDASTAVYSPLAGQMNMYDPGPQGMLQDPLFQKFALSAGALAGGAALAGAGGLGAAGGAEAASGSLPAAEAFPVAGGAAIPATDLGAAGAAGASGITGAQALQYAKMGLSGLGIANQLAGGQGTGSTQQGGGQGTGSTQQVSANGPWNTPLVGQNLTWAKQNEAPVTAGDSKLSMLFPQLDPALAKQLAISGNTGSNLGGNYFSYGSPAQTTQPTGYKEGGGVLQSFKEGGTPHVPEFITGATGHYVKGKGTGQSDEIPAMLADGEFVWDADTVAQLGDGSSDAGAKLLDEFRKSVRSHKRSAPSDKIPPKASPLQYMKEAMHRTGRK